MSPCSFHPETSRSQPTYTKEQPETVATGVVSFECTQQEGVAKEQCQKVLADPSGETNLGDITSMINKKPTTEMMTLDTHSTVIMTIYGCAVNVLERCHALRVWWMMDTAVNAAHADENPNRNVTSVRESHDGFSSLYQGGTRKPPMLLGVEV